MTGLPVRAIVVLTFDLPSPDDVVQVLKAIDPPHLPHFAGDARVAVDPEASAVLEWLDAEEAPRTCRACGCTDDDCSGCIERTGTACHWVESDLCSACKPAPTAARLARVIVDVAGDGATRVRAALAASEPEGSSR
jgi:hypothetical protein